MRKMTVEIAPHPSLIKAGGKAMDMIHSSTILDILRLDFEKGYKVVLAELRLNEGYRLEDVPLPEGSQFLAILKQEGDVYTVLVKTQAPREFLHIMRKMDLDVVWDVPVFKSKEKIVISVIGDEPALRQFMEQMREFGQVRNVTFRAISIHEHGLLRCLTDRQKQVMVAAKRSGYYDYPRRIDSGELAKKLGLSKSTVVEHLRRAEKKLITNLLMSY